MSVVAAAPIESFFEKDLGNGVPEWVPRQSILHSGGEKHYPVAVDRATLVWFAQSAALELHGPTTVTRDWTGWPLISSTPPSARPARPAQAQLPPAAVATVLGWQLAAQRSGLHSRPLRHVQNASRYRNCDRGDSV
ncbi:non-homologous end-joining DNA ligase LigD [Leifsonia aquatica]|uniref:non-homologous end-joining DNA ligase LigD n=1 Tax=Leifsonia aquatica TaxID=144185 RepID=UPI003820CC0D